MKDVPRILERFHDAHNTVLDWMQQIETELNQCEVKPGLEAELRLQVYLMIFINFQLITSKCLAAAVMILLNR